MKNAIKLMLIAILLISFMPELEAQCAMCKSNIEMARQNNSTNVGNTLNNGILYLLALPYLIAMSFGFIYYKKYKQKKAEQAITQFNS
jgi:hypothetical protein